MVSILILSGIVSHARQPITESRATAFTWNWIENVVVYFEAHDFSFYLSGKRVLI